MRTGAPIAGRARRTARRAAGQSYGSPCELRSCPRAQTQTVTHSAIVMRIAGITAAANRAPVDTAATEAKTTAGMLGGMIGLISAELALRPTANSAG